MKRPVISLVMVVLALFIAVFSFYDVKRNAAELETRLNAAARYFENGDTHAGSAECRWAIEIWRKCRGRFELYLNSEELFEIDTDFAASPKRRLIAATSAASPRCVAVPCALI